MAKRKIAIKFLALCICIYVCVWSAPCFVHAVSTSDSSELIDLKQGCELNVCYTYNKTTFSHIPVKLYKIAEFTADFQYTPTSSFAESGIDLNGIQSNDEWKVIRSTVESNILANDIKPSAIKTTDKHGLVSFNELKPGLYMAVVDVIVRGNLKYYFESALLTLPTPGSDGFLKYNVTAAPKAELVSPDNDGGRKKMKVIKLWRGDSGKNSRPKKIKVAIYRNEKIWKTVTLSDKNMWSYSWRAKADGAKWGVVEDNIPSGYYLTVQDRKTYFILTNTFINYDNPDKEDTPKTGDTSNVMFFVELMFLAGFALIILGIIGKKNAYKKSK